MKNGLILPGLFLALTIFVSAPCLAATVSFSCSSKKAGDLGLPSKIFVELEGSQVSLQNTENDIYFTGKMTGPAINAVGSRIAIGFTGLIMDGYVVIGADMLKKAKTSTMIIADEALDSVKTYYSCKLD